MSDSRPPRKSQRRWLSFSLRTFLLLITAFGVWLGWIVNRANRQKEAVESIHREMGGEVRYGFELDADYLSIQNAKPFAPDWLCDALGIDFFASVKSVRLFGDHIEDISPLANLPHLENLNLESTVVSNLDLLAKLTCLKRLVLFENHVTNLTPLSNLTDLRVLLVHERQVEDISCLTRLKELEALDLSFSRVSDFTLISEFPNLEILALYGTSITEIEFVRTLKKLKIVDIGETQIHEITPLRELNLEGLTLKRTKVSDLTPISNHHNLRQLIVSNSPICDIKPLEHLSQLQDLFLDGCPIKNIAAISTLTSLRILSLDTANIDDLMPLGSLSKLNKFYFIDTKENKQQEDRVKAILPACQVVSREPH